MAELTQEPVSPDVKAGETKPEIQQAGQTPPTTQPTTTPTTSVQAGDADGDGDGENDAGWKSRLGREVRKTLKSLGLPSELEAAKEILARAKSEQEQALKDRSILAKYKKAEDDAKRAKMTREEQLVAEVEKLRADVQTAKHELIREREEIDAVRGDAKVTDIAREMIAPEYVKFAKRDLADWIMSLPKQEREDLDRDPSAIKTWLQQFVVDHPVFAIKTDTKVEPKPQVTRPHTSGVPSPGTPRPTSEMGGKTIKPGPHQMSKEDVRTAAAQMGVKYPS